MYMYMYTCTKPKETVIAGLSDLTTNEHVQ